MNEPSNKDDGDDSEEGDEHTLTATSTSMPAPTIAPTPSQRPSPEIARSYLAWLNQRQARFPRAPPNYLECITVAKKLGRPTHKVFDEIVYYCGLENVGDQKEWYKQNRLALLGEDPRFDEETMGWWAAWLKQGRDEKAKEDAESMRK